MIELSKEKHRLRSSLLLISVFSLWSALPLIAAAEPAAESVGAEHFDKIELEAPKLQALISINKSLDPFALDASGSKNISLPEVLRIAVSENLDIKIRQQDVSSKAWTLFSSYGKFLPDINLGYRYQFLHGTIKTPFFGGNGAGAKINSPFIISNAGFSYYAYQGGKVLNTALQNRNYLHAGRFQEKASLSDTLFEATRRYFNLVLSEAILQIRIKAVETSEEQLKLSDNLLIGGKATRLDVLQARTQLSSDRQRLIDQQIARRSAAIDLADLLNIDQGVDLVPASRVVERARLISENATPAVLLKTAVENRPELKQFKELWLAAKKTAKIDAANLQPNFQFFGNVYGLGETLGHSSRNVSTSISPVTLSSSTAGSSGSILVQRNLSRQIAPLYTLGYAVNWNFDGMGLVDTGNIQAARAQARQSMLELNKKVNSVTNEVRQSYLKTLSAYRKLDETMAKVESATEELRLARMRYQYGVGKNIDVLKAQEDYTSAQIENAQAMITYNISQAQLLRDLGVISVSNLLSGVPLKLQ
ncbi:MAG: TolC family protein [Candidatus Obscuribacterales bacterium]|nr:TolC family protein [Candidatus Obscuribacterales bacterium]